MGSVQRGATTTHVRDEYQRLTTGSQALWQRALGSLPGGNTRTTIFHDPYPVYLERGEGCRVWDVDGVERIDFISNYTSSSSALPSTSRGRRCRARRRG